MSGLSSGNGNIQVGSGYLGSSDFITSTENQEIVPESPSNWTVGYHFYKFIFNNLADCKVRINDGEPIFIPAYQGFEIGTEDKSISSFVIITPDVQFSWIGYF